MRTVEQTLKGWSTTFGNPPRLNQEQTIAVSLLGVVFLVMAVLQIIGFSDFKDSLARLGLSSGVETWAVIVVLAEVWAALAFLQVRLNGLIRFFGGFFAVLAGLFWLLVSLQAVAGSNSLGLTNSGFFGKYLTQAPGWWTVIEASVLFFWTVYALQLSKR